MDGELMGLGTQWGWPQQREGNSKENFSVWNGGTGRMEVAKWQHGSSASPSFLPQNCETKILILTLLSS